ncbi:MAG TPA: zf-HC2 domain-containing protein [Blastocatellia bacterium]|nr:zf-HC2 domain-containing protein [Blastocatellia bacterium]
MNCNEFEMTASAYIDRQLDEDKSAEYRTHLSQCSACRFDLAETEAASIMLRRADRLEAPRELHSYVMSEISRHANNEIGMFQRFFEWVLKLNPQPIAYASGAVISAVLFGAFLSSFRPIPHSGVRVVHVAILPAIHGSDSEYHSYNNLPPDKGTPASEHYYELPRVLDNSALVSFSHIAYQKPGNQGMSAMVEVGEDGRAKLVDVLDSPKDPYVIEQLWWSLRSRTFQPATVSGHPVSTRIILLVEKMDVSG